MIARHLQPFATSSESQQLIYNDLWASGIDTDCLRILQWHRLIYDTRLTTFSAFNCCQWRAGPALGINIAVAQVPCSPYPTQFTLRHTNSAFGFFIIEDHKLRGLISRLTDTPCCFILRPWHYWTSLKCVVCGM